MGGFSDVYLFICNRLWVSLLLLPRLGVLPFLHDQHHPQKDNYEEKDAGNGPCDFHRVVRLLLWLHRIWLACGGPCNE